MKDSGEVRPNLLVFAGVSGTGKTTVARELSIRTGQLVVLETDITKQTAGPMAPIFSLNTHGPTSSIVMRGAYNRMQEMARELLTQGIDVAMVAVHGSKAAHAGALKVGEDTGANVYPYELVAPVETSGKRVRQRPAGHMSGITSEDEVIRMSANYHPFPGARVFDTSRVPLPEIVRQIMHEVWGEGIYRPTTLREVMAISFRDLPYFRKLRSG